MEKIFIGTCGWSYNHWEEVFYPKIPAQRRLHFYAQFFKTVEVNSTFYGLPRMQTVKNWTLQVPPSFCFSIKASRFITHVKRLKNCQESLQLFYNQIGYFEQQVGPILFQLPPSFEKDTERLQEFVELLSPQYKYTFEFRADSWFDEEVYELLKEKKIALCISDLNGSLSPIEVTADFVYIRLHGPEEAYQGYYGKTGLASWAKRIEDWVNRDEKGVYIYFDNTDKGPAIQDAQLLEKMIEEK